MNTNNNSSNFWLQVKKEYIDEKEKFYINLYQSYEYVYIVLNYQSN